jgi:hypothetical protein
MRGRQWTLGFGWLVGYKAFLTIYLCTSEAWRPSGVQVRCIASERRGDVTGFCILLSTCAFSRCVLTLVPSPAGPSRSNRVRGRRAVGAAVPAPPGPICPFPLRLVSVTRVRHELKAEERM